MKFKGHLSSIFITALIQRVIVETTVLFLLKTIVSFNSCYCKIKMEKSRITIIITIKTISVSICIAEM